MAFDLEQAKAHLKEHGWVIIPSVLAQTKTTQALERLWKAKQAVDSRGEATFIPFLDPNANNVRLFNLLEEDEVFRDLVSHPTALEMVKMVLGDVFLVSNFTANIARPGSKSMALHSDQSLNSPEPWQGIAVVSAIWCLTDVTRDNGTTLYIPGSNKWSTKAEVPDNAPELLVPFEASAGDVIIMDGRLWHTSGSNVTKDEDRAMVFAYYTAPHMRPVVNWAAKLPKQLQDTLSQDLKDLLGLAPYANLPVLGDLRHMSLQYPGIGGGEVEVEAVAEGRAAVLT